MRKLKLAAIAGETVTFELDFGERRFRSRVAPFRSPAGEIVGLAFDGNIHSISGSYWFDDRLNRSIGVHPAYIRTALEKVYGATALLEEINRR